VTFVVLLLRLLGHNNHTQLKGTWFPERYPYIQEAARLKIIITPGVEKKLAKKHGGVREAEIQQAFLNREGPILRDDREEHASDPPTLWFCAPTDRGRMLKIVYIAKDGQILLKTAFEPEAPTLAFYKRKSK